MKYFNILFLFSSFAFAQINKNDIDSLLTHVNPIMKLKLDKNESIKWNQNIINESQKLKYKNGVIHGYINIANILWNASDYEESIKYLDQAVLETNKNDNINLGRIYIEYAQVYCEMNLFQLALEKSELAENYLLESKSSNKLLGYVYSCQAVYLYELKRNEEALKKLHKAVKYDKNVVSLSNIAYYYIEINYNSDSAKIYLDKSFDVLNISKNYADIDQASLYKTQGDFEFTRNDFKNAEIAYLKSKSILKKSNFPHIYANKHTTEALIKLYFKTSDLEKLRNSQIELDSINKILNNNVNLGINHSINHLSEQNTLSKEKNSYKNLIILIIITITIVIILSLVKIFNRQIQNKDVLLSNKIKESQILKVKLDDSLIRLIELVKNNDTSFLIQFEKIYPNFYENLLKINPNLVTSEISFCALLTLNFSNKELSQYTFTTIKNIENKKTRLKTRLNLSRDQNINLWLKNKLI